MPQAPLKEVVAHTPEVLSPGPSSGSVVERARLDTSVSNLESSRGSFSQISVRGGRRCPGSERTHRQAQGQQPCGWRVPPELREGRQAPTGAEDPGAETVRTVVAWLQEGGEILGSGRGDAQLLGSARF